MLLLSIRDVKHNYRFVNADIDEETLKIITFFNESFPESVSGVGLMSEAEATGGGDRERDFLQYRRLEQ